MRDSGQANTLSSSTKEGGGRISPLEIEVRKGVITQAEPDPENLIGKGGLFSNTVTESPPVLTWKTLRQTLQHNT